MKRFILSIFVLALTINLVQGQEDKTTATKESTSETKVWNHHAMHNRNMWLGGVFSFGSESI